MYWADPTAPPSSVGVGYDDGASYLSVAVTAGQLSDPATTTIGGRPARVESLGGQVAVNIQFPGHVAHLAAGPHEDPSGTARLDEATVVGLAAGYTEAPGDDPAAWPIGPSG
jgi:regulation of enolase protein 1 (concanavalin A-like superfamily)